MSNRESRWARRYYRHAWRSANDVPICIIAGQGSAGLAYLVGSGNADESHVQQQQVDDWRLRKFHSRLSATFSSRSGYERHAGTGVETESGLDAQNKLQYMDVKIAFGRAVPDADDRELLRRKYGGDRIKQDFVTAMDLEDDPLPAFQKTLNIILTELKQEQDSRDGPG